MAHEQTTRCDYCDTFERTVETNENGLLKRKTERGQGPTKHGPGHDTVVVVDPIRWHIVKIEILAPRRTLDVDARDIVARADLVACCEPCARALVAHVAGSWERYVFQPPPPAPPAREKTGPGIEGELADLVAAPRAGARR